MIVVTVARRPLMEGSVAANALKHETGALHVDACRVAGVPTTYPARRSAYAPLPGDTRSEAGRGLYAQPASDNLPPPHLGGRWPANLILSHLDGCRNTGARKVKGTGPGHGGGFKDGKFSGQVGNGEYTHTSFAGFAGEDGMETVETWNCEPGCPVAELDADAGHLHARGNRKPTTGGGGLYGLAVIEKDSGPMDGGGASRFFKQVGGRR